MGIKRRVQVERLRLAGEIPQPEQARFRPALLGHGQLIVVGLADGNALVQRHAHSKRHWLADGHGLVFGHGLACGALAARRTAI